MRIYVLMIKHMSKYDYLDAPQCPHCDHVDHDWSSEIVKDGWLMRQECEECEKTYYTEMHITFTFSSKL